MDIFKILGDSFNNLIHHNILFSLLPQLPNPFAGFHLSILANRATHPVLAPFFSLLFPALFLMVLVLALYLVSKYLPKILSLLYNLKQSYTLLEIKPLRDTKLSAQSTKQLFELLHGLINSKTDKDKFFQRKKICSLEIVSSKSLGIRYLLRVYSKDEDIIRKKLLSYFPEINIAKTDDYFPEDSQRLHGFYKAVELKLLNHFAAPLKSKNELEEDDPISYITGNMTKLESNELVAIQLIVSPVDESSHKAVTNNKNQVNTWINNGYDLTYYLRKRNKNILVWFLTLLLKIAAFTFVSCLGFLLDMIKGFFFHDISPHSDNTTNIFFSKPKYKQTDNPYHRELEIQVKKKIDSQLFETTLRLFVQSDRQSHVLDRIRGLNLSFNQFENSPHQKLINGFKFSNFGSLKNQRIEKLKFWILKHRLDFFSQTSVLSTSEIADIYHLPYTSTTKTEDISKTYSKELPAPLSFKQDRKYDVILGVNTFGGTRTFIGLTDDERARHKLVIGGSGTGKSTMILSEIVQDIKKGRGIAVIDPHGDLADPLRYFIPEKRAKDFVWLDPDDLDNPIIINLLELTPGLKGNELLREKQFVSESIITLFRKIFSGEGTWSTNAHRIEHILRNAIYTAFEVEDSTIFTIMDLFENPVFRKTVVNSLKDKKLQDFWKTEYSKAGDWQQVKMMGGITSRISAFLNAPSARKMMEKPRSTINFDKIMDEKKILICNLSRGKLTEPISELIGMVILNKIQLATLRRARVEVEKRTPFYLYVDEFQYFANKSFVQMLSEGRKYGLRITIVHQSTAQQADNHLTNIIFANVGTIIFFRNSSTMDEDVFLPIFYPYIEKGALNYLPAYHFYIKISAINPEEPFSGETIMLKVKKDPKQLERLLDESKKRYTIPFKEVEETKELKMNKSNNQAEVKVQIPQIIEKVSPEQSVNPSSSKYV